MTTNELATAPVVSPGRPHLSLANARSGLYEHRTVFRVYKDMYILSS